MYKNISSPSPLCLHLFICAYANTQQSIIYKLERKYKLNFYDEKTVLILVFPFLKTISSQTPWRYGTKLGRIWNQYSRIPVISVCERHKRTIKNDDNWLNRNGILSDSLKMARI